MANKNQIEEKNIFTIDDKVIEIGLQHRKNNFVAYKYVCEDKTLRSKYEIYTTKHFEARKYYNKLINEYQSKIKEIHGV